MPKNLDVIDLDATRVLQLLKNSRAMEILTKLPKNVEKNVIRRALYAGAVIVRDAARDNLGSEPGERGYRTGALKKAIMATTQVSDAKGGIRARVTIAKKAFRVGANGTAKVVSRKGIKRLYIKGDIYPRNYAHLVEFGTEPHSLGAGSMRRLRKGKKDLGAGAQFGAQHPGAVAVPFFRPAMQRTQAARNRMIVQKIIDGTEVELAKL